MNNLSATRWYHYLVLIGILTAAFFFRTFNIQDIGFGNLYYASTVYSMLTSPSNFFFGSFDPAGFVTVDKPPFGFWIQSLSAIIFGFKGWALLLPQIIAGVLSCLVLFWLVRRFYGPNAGILAAFILAVTPIAIATDRNNTIDAQLLLTLLLSVVMLVKAVDKGSFLWLLAGAVLIGIGFNIKMLQAYMILPAFYGLYFLAANTTWLRRILHLGLVSIALFVVSFAWPITMDIIPEEDRPYIGSSQNNSVTELITGHNGVKRLGMMAGLIGLKPEGGPGQPVENPPLRPLLNNQNEVKPQRGIVPFNMQRLSNPNGAGMQNFQPPKQGGFGGQPPDGGPGGGPGGNETGSAGLLRLFNEQLVGQTSWLLPLALLMIPVLFFRKKFTWPFDRESQFVIFWGLWLIPMVIFFSFAGLFHRYYLEMLAPSIAAFVAAGLVSLSRDFTEKRSIGWWLPVCILGSAVFEAGIVSFYWPGWAGWATVVTIMLGGLSFFGLIFLRLLSSNFRFGIHLFVILGVVAMMIIPVLWSTATLSTGDTGLPHAGPDLVQKVQNPIQQNIRLNNNGLPQRVNFSMDKTKKLVEYLNTNFNSETFIVAGMRASDVAPIILQTGKAAMAIGGFTGSDPILSVDGFEAYINNGQLRYVLIGENPGPNGNNKQDISDWVMSTCKIVPQIEWSEGNLPINRPVPSDPGGIQALYDCQ